MFQLTVETFVGIGDRLKEERERLGFNQTEFAAKAGVSKNSQYNYEKGERSPDATCLAAIAENGVDILYVVTGEHKPVSADWISTDAASFLFFSEHQRARSRCVVPYGCCLCEGRKHRCKKRQRLTWSKAA